MTYKLSGLGVTLIKINYFRSILLKLRYSFVFFTIFEYITNSQHDQLPVVLIAQLVQHCTSIRIPCKPEFVFQALSSQILKLCPACIPLSYY